MISDIGIEQLYLVSESDPYDLEDESTAGMKPWLITQFMAGFLMSELNTLPAVTCLKLSRFATIQYCKVLNPLCLPISGGSRYQFNLSDQMGLVKYCFTNNDFIS
ncbi:hypothetical protein BGX28_004813 [Mortierella sp. GBA30]|nr:hypothetical protein BGX28_004813 [Mortierella sp. GBA30]